MPTSESPTPKNGAGEAATKPVLPITEAELHYKSLTDFFKYLVVITGIFLGFILTAGYYVSHKDLESLKADAKKDIAEMKAEVRQSLLDAKTETRYVVGNTQNEARQAIDQTKNQASSQISQIREQASFVALNEAQKRIDNAFRTTNIETLIENTAKKEVAPIFERQVKGEIDRIVNSLEKDALSAFQLADYSADLRSLNRAGLDSLIKFIKNSPEGGMRKKAISVFEAYSSMIDSSYRINMNGITALEYNGLRKNKEGKFITNPYRVIMKTIRTSDNLWDVAGGFLMLREITNEGFKMYDFDAVEKWCAKHPESCN